MLNTIRRLPKFLRAIDFWSNFIEEVDVEISNLKTDIDAKKNFFNPRELLTIEDLRALNTYFGFVIDTSLFNDIYDTNPQIIIDYLRSEARNMIFKITSKGTKNYHDYIFNRIQALGYVYVLFHDVQNGGKLYRAVNFYDTDLPRVNIDLLNHDFSTAPFTKVTSLVPFASGFVSQNNLDEGLTLDAASPWTLDYSLFGASVSMTKYIVAEFMADQLYTVGSDTLMITNEKLEYLRKSISFARKATESPNVGIGVTAYTLNDQAILSIPVINVDTNITANWAGTGDNAEYAEYSLTTGLAETYFKSKIVDTQIYVDSNFDLVNISFPTSQSNQENAGIGDGSNDSFVYSLLYPSIEPLNFSITYLDAGATERIIKDDGNGNLYYPEFFSVEDLRLGLVDLADFAIGSINYTTGAIAFSTLDTSGGAVDVTPGNLEELNIKYYTNYGFSLENIKILNNVGATVVNIDFPTIRLTKKEYHASFLIVVDKR